MNWNRLKNYKCPKCNELLGHEMVKDSYDCSKIGCGFSIGKEKFNKIVNDKYYKEPVRDNFEALQNLGHKEITEDFSDSRHLIY